MTRERLSEIEENAKMHDAHAAYLKHRTDEHGWRVLDVIGVECHQYEKLVNDQLLLIDSLKTSADQIEWLWGAVNQLPHRVLLRKEFNECFEIEEE